MSLKTANKKLRLEISRRRTTKCAVHGCRDCRFEGCYSPGRSRARWMPRDERTIKPPVKPMLGPVPGPVPKPATKTELESSEVTTTATAAEAWAKSRARATAAGLLALSKHDSIPTFRQSPFTRR
jgi:hypothetical protein